MLFKDTLSPQARSEWDNAHANPAAEISQDPEVQAAAVVLQEARDAYSKARREAKVRLFG